LSYTRVALNASSAGANQHITIFGRPVNRGSEIRVLSRAILSESRFSLSRIMREGRNQPLFESNIRCADAAPSATHCLNLHQPVVRPKLHVAAMPWHGQPIAKLLACAVAIITP